MKEKIIKIAIADNHPIMRQGIKDIINAYGGFEIIIEAADGAELLMQLHHATHLPDICILDSNIEYIHTLTELKKRWASVKVLIFSLFHSEFIIHEMVRNGANGYLEKTCNSRRLIQALTCIYHSDYFFSEAVAKKVFDSYKRQIMPRITERETDFLCHCCSELSYKEISELMNVSVRTVETYRDTLCGKFKIKTRVGLVMFALQNGIVPLHNEIAAAY